MRCAGHRSEREARNTEAQRVRQSARIEPSVKDSLKFLTTGGCRRLSCLSRLWPSLNSNLVQTAPPAPTSFCLPYSRTRPPHHPPSSPLPRPPRCQPSAFRACCSRSRKRYHLQASHQHLTPHRPNAAASHQNYNSIFKTQRKTPGKFQERGGLHHLLRHRNHHPQLSPQSPCSPQSPNASQKLLFT